MLLPDYSTLSPSLRSAELRNGNLIPCGPGVRGVGWPDCPAIRGQALLELLRDTECTAILATAAWVWGVDVVPDDLYTFSSLNGARYLKTVDPRVRMHEYSVGREDTVMVGGSRITSVMRTLYDLLYLGDLSFEHHGGRVAEQLIELHPIKPQLFAQQFQLRNRPYSLRAASRFTALLGVSQ